MTCKEKEANEVSRETYQLFEIHFGREPGTSRIACSRLIGQSGRFSLNLSWYRRCRVPPNLLFGREAAFHSIPYFSCIPSVFLFPVAPEFTLATNLFCGKARFHSLFLFHMANWWLTTGFIHHWFILSIGKKPSFVISGIHSSPFANWFRKQLPVTHKT